MKTTIPAIEAINTTEDVKKFFSELFSNREEFHPEDDPKDIINGPTGQPLFTPEEAVKVDEVMGRVWEVCNIEGSDPCEIMLNVCGSTILE